MNESKIIKKVYYFSNSNLESKQANAIHTLKMCSAFTKNNYEITLFAKKGKGKVRLDQLYGIKINFPIIYNIWLPIQGVGGIIYGIRNFISALKSGIPTLVYGRDLYSILFSRLLFCKIRYESHEPPNNRLRYFLEGNLFRLKRYEKLVVISNALKDIYMDLYPFLKHDDIIVAHDGSDEVNEYDLISVELPNKYFQLKIGYVGSLYMGRGINLIIELAKLFPHHGFYIIGEKNDRFDNICLTNLFFNGPVNHRLVPSFLNQFDILLAPYQQRVTLLGDKGDTSKFMSPLKIFEYMASGKAIIASDLPVIREVLQNECNSLLCKPDTVDQWKNAIIKLEHNSLLRNYLGNNAQKDLLNKYTWKNRVVTVMGE